MCGFVGFITKNKNKKQIVEDMMNKIIHRGPDSSGTYVDKTIALGFRRLSIIDLNSGDQPMYNEDKTKVLVFNGEIYNFQIIREELIEKGHTFVTSSDTEVLIHGYEEYGVDLLNKLRGMFSFALWDKVKKELFMARDFFGIKPLYYYKNKDTFIFGSEIKSFLANPAFKKELNEDMLEQYLSFQYSVGNATFFKNVCKLQPGHYLIYKKDKLEVTKYFEAKFAIDETNELDYHVDEIDRAFKDSIEAHKISDVEVGSFLSSGVDSSYVASVAMVNKTFTVGFDETVYSDKYNETKYAKDLSEKIGVENISKLISKKEYFENLSKIQYHMDEPLADASSIALYFVAKLASEKVKVALSGEGADELFGGYITYNEPFSVPLYSKLPFCIRWIVGKIASLLPEIRGINFLVRKGKKIEDRYIGDCFVFTDRERKKVLKNKTNALKTSEFTKQFYDKVSKEDDVTKMQYLDINVWLVGDILLKADKMSMANSLEVRVPFLDKEVLEVAKCIPTKYKVTKETTKYALRCAAKKSIPNDAYNKKKLGFPVPIAQWLREEETYNLVKDSFNSKTALKYFNHKYIIKLLNNHKNNKKNNWRKIWNIYIFLVWHEEFFAK